MRNLLETKPVDSFLLTESPSLNSLKSSKYFFEREYQNFLNWWQDYQKKFSNFSFRIDNQVDLFFDQWKKSNLEIAFSQIRADLYGYYLEYIKQEAVIPFSLRLNDDKRVFGEFYGEKDIEEIIDERERGGIVKKAISDLKEKLRNLGNDEIVFRISPAGWTGLDYQYTETQAQILWLDEENPKRIRGLTLRTKIDLEGILSLLYQLGFEKPKNVNNEIELIKWITSLNIILPTSWDSFLNFLGERFGIDHQGRDLKKQIENWRNQDRDFYYFDRITNLVEFLQEKINQMINLGLTEEEIIQEMKALLGFILMTMTAQEMNSQKIKETSAILIPSPNIGQTYYLPGQSYNQVIDYLLSLPGCAGGGGATKDFQMMTFGPVNKEMMLIDEIKCVTCPFCGKTVDAKIVQVDNDKYIQCPECKKRKPFKN